MPTRPLAIPSLALALTLLHSATALAATVYTPFVRMNAVQSMRVQVTNIGKKDIDVTVALQDFTGTPQVPFADECAENAPLEPGSTCRVFYSSGVEGFATVKSRSGKVRATITVLDDTGALVAVVPATK